MQLIELAAQYRATGNALRARAATLRLELAAMPRAGRARRDLEDRAPGADGGRDSVHGELSRALL